MRVRRGLRIGPLLVVAALTVTGCGSRAPEAAKVRARGLTQAGASGQSLAGTGAARELETANGGEGAATGAAGEGATPDAGNLPVAGAAGAGAANEVDRAAA